jgi:hypothetical protein
MIRWLSVACALLLTAWPTAARPGQSQTTAAGPLANAWRGREAAIEAHLRTATITRVEDIGTGVTHPQRAYLEPAAPVDSLVWKPLAPGFRGGYWESYKSEIAAYQLDRLLQLHMVPPAVERQIGGEMGAAIMWLDGARSVKQTGGQVPTGPIWGGAIRRMLMFDNFIGNPDRNAGNILLGNPGELILIDHSRAFLTDTRVQAFERVDAAAWKRLSAVSADDLGRVLRPWMEERAVDAAVKRRAEMVATVDRLIKARGRAAVLIP